MESIFFFIFIEDVFVFTEKYKKRDENARLHLTSSGSCAPIEEPLLQPVSHSKRYRVKCFIYLKVQVWLTFFNSFILLLLFFFVTM